MRLDIRTPGRPVIRIAGGAERKLVIITEPEALHSGPGHYDARGDVGYKHTPSNLQIQLIAMAAQSGQTNTLVPSVISLPM
jgi:hypothetical protein